MREYLRPELRVSVPVTRLAKWKTTAQLVAIGFLLAGEAGDQLLAAITGNEVSPVVTLAGLTLLWGFLCHRDGLYTSYDYFPCRRAPSDGGMSVEAYRFLAWRASASARGEEVVDLPARRGKSWSPIS